MVFDTLKNFLNDEQKGPAIGNSGSIASINWGSISGQGLLTFSNEDRFEGFWVNGQLSGQGTYIWADRSSYAGEWKDSKRHGKGVMSWADGRTYEGEWTDNKRNGKGTMRWPTSVSSNLDGPDNFSSEGDKDIHRQSVFVGGTSEEAEKSSFSPNSPLRSSIRRLTISSPVAVTNTTTIKYEGEWKDDKRHGKGTMNWATGEIYEGEWKEDKRHGYGSMSTVQTLYKGDWRENKRNGKGQLMWANGSHVEGDWKDDKLNGNGYAIFASGGEYKGKYKDNQRSGKGSRIFADGSVYEGEWSEDLRSGKGKMVWPDGRKYEGQWSKGKRHGHGSMTWADGRWYEGEWREDKAPEAGEMPKLPEEANLLDDGKTAFLVYDSSNPVLPDTSNLCVICVSKPREMLFEPCNHVVVCAQCAPEVQKCPVCNALITYEKRIFLN